MNDSTFQTLAESPHFILGHSYETVSVVNREDSVTFLAGEHYGDPGCGLITEDEAWFVTAGEGIQCYSSHTGLLTFFRRGFSPIETQFSEPSWHVHSITLESLHVIRVLIDPWSKHASVWRLDLDKQTLEKLSDGPFLADSPYQELVEF